MSDLLSCNIIEKDSNEDIIWTWTYPAVSEKQKDLIIKKCTFELSNAFTFGRFYTKWFYIYSFDVSEAPSLPDVKEFACVLWAKDFNPEKYEKLCNIMGKTYLDSGNPVSLLQLYLSVITKGACSAKENGTFLIKDYSSSNSHKETRVKDLIKLFGLEVILIYTALLLKKKLVIYHHSLPILLQWLTTFPSLMGHRNASEILFPWLDLAGDDMQQLKISTSYIAGFCDNAIFSRTDLYDVIVNLPAGEISISPQAKEGLVMTKIHKDIALYLVELSESDITEQNVVGEVGNKTEELLTQLRSIGKTMDDGRCLVSVETLKEKNFSSPMESFLFQLALAENMLLL